MNQPTPFSSACNPIFDRCVSDYHRIDDVDAVADNPFAEGDIQRLLYHKCWIDTVQWHLEDIVRNPSIDPAEGLALKRRIDKSNQDRTDIVEQLDSYFLHHYREVVPQPDARVNTESPAWAVDRLSILALKIYHMNEEVNRADAEDAHRERCRQKLDVLREQRTDLSRSIDQLLQDIESGRNIMKVYRQMKMYNDPSLNPVLYNRES